MESNGQPESNTIDNRRASARFEITILALGRWPAIEITADEFEQARAAKKSCVITLGIEEKLDILLEDYAEYESELLNLALRYMLFHGKDWSSFMSDMQKVNRRLSNLLSAARLYLDQVKHDLSTIYGKNSQQHEDLNKSLSQEYDSRLAYRVMEALRNYVQHRSLPIQRLAYPSSWENTESETGRRLRFSVEPELDIKQITEDGGFKGTVLEELKLQGKDFLNVTPFVRQYVESIGRAHESLRKRLKADIEAWEHTLSELIERAREPLDGNLTGLGLVARGADGVYLETMRLSTNMTERRCALERKNSSLDSISFRYVAGTGKLDEATGGD